MRSSVPVLAVVAPAAVAGLTAGTARVIVQLGN